MVDIDAVKTALLTTAASIGVEAHKSLIEARDKAKKTQAKYDEWKDKKADADDAASDSDAGAFTTIRFKAMGAVAKAFGENAPWNDPHSDVPASIAQDMAVSFMESFTGTTKKTKAGGTEQAIGRFIRTGLHGARIIAALQARLDHWTTYRADAEGEGLEPSERKAIKDRADEFLKLADSAKTDKTTGVVVKPAKYMGRMGVVVNGITIGTPGQRRGGTNRTAQLTEAAALFIQHGDTALDDDVLDALLSNGGVAPRPDAMVEGVAAEAARLIEELMEKHGGKNMADGLELTMMLPTLKRIASQGFTAPKHAAAPVATNGTAPYAIKAETPKAPPAPPAKPKAPPAPVTPPAPLAKPQADMLAELPEAGGDDDGITEEAPGKAPPAPVTSPPQPVAAKPKAPPAPAKPKVKVAAPPRRGDKDAKVGLV